MRKYAGSARRTGPDLAYIAAARLLSIQSGRLTHGRLRKLVGHRFEGAAAA
jgi:hypothetical protein